MPTYSLGTKVGIAWGSWPKTTTTKVPLDAIFKTEKKNNKKYNKKEELLYRKYRRICISSCLGKLSPRSSMPGWNTMWFNKTSSSNRFFTKSSYVWSHFHSKNISRLICQSQCKGQIVLLIHWLQEDRLLIQSGMMVCSTNSYTIRSVEKFMIWFKTLTRKLNVLLSILIKEQNSLTTRKINDKVVFFRLWYPICT